MLTDYCELCLDFEVFCKVMEIICLCIHFPMVCMYNSVYLAVKKNKILSFAEQVNGTGDQRVK